jgi:G patch domain/KOW motif-containing protein
MGLLPEEADAAAYEAMPIAEFGAAMMRGMGWSEGKGVGRRQVGPTTPFQYVQRPQRLGLGAQPAAPQVSTKGLLVSIVSGLKVRWTTAHRKQ